MSPPPEYEQLSPEQAARVDATCDSFEQAWKAVPTGGTMPRLASYLDRGEEPERTILLRELVALDRACRQRYGVPIQHEDYQDLGVAAEAALGADTPFVRRGAGAPLGGAANWPRLPGLELVEVLGSGGMGVVFKARQPMLERDVAVKLLRDVHLAGPEQHERFLQEARAVARLQHPHLVHLYEFGEVPSAGGATAQPYLVLDYVSGGSLADRLRGSPQPPGEAARLVETLADAIHYAHQQGVIHRDLKPANILLSKDGIPKITDFGLAKVLTSNDLTRSGDVLGTPSYMAPEQVTGKSGAITVAVDVYGLGALLYELLTGRPPFLADTVTATLLQVQQEEPVPPRRLQPTVPPDLETICLKCLRKEAGRRYATAQELADDLRRFRAGESIRARPVGTAERVVLWCRRKPGLAGLLTALVLVFLTGLGGVLWESAQAQQNAAAFQRERDTAQRQQERAEHHLRILRTRLDRLNQLGRDLLERPGEYNTGKAVLEEALAFYEELLPEESSDPQLRREAAQMYGRLASIRHTLGQWGKAAEAYRQQADLLSGLQAEEPANTRYCRQLATSHRNRGNALRDLGKVPEAREAYDQAAALYEQLYRESPGGDTGVDLANTLLNTTTLLSPRQQADELERLFRRILELAGAAVAADPDNPRYQAELALDLEGQGLFFLRTGRHRQAVELVRQALAIRQKLLPPGRMKGISAHYVGRNYAYLARALAAAGQAREAEQAYREGEKVLEQLLKEYPEMVLSRAALVETLGLLADHLKDSSRPQEVEEIRRRVIGHCEILKANAPEDSQYRVTLVLSYLELVSLLWQLGRQSEAAEPFRKALEVDPEDPAVNNQLAWFLATSVEPRLRDAALAVRLANKAVAGQPQSLNYQNTLGVAHYRNGDNKAAVAALETAMSLRAGGNSFDWFFLAMAHGRLGDREKARQWYDRAVEWMDKFEPQDEELRRFHAEAKALLAERGKP
jgi:tetratricopeptide (TPR) repeat protein/tRNA A-37 threonylcarbamoyl transferase component Bud32